MKLVHVDLEKPIAIHRNCPTEWIIESPELFLRYVEQLQKQNQGEEIRQTSMESKTNKEIDRF